MKAQATLDTSIWIPYLREGRYEETVEGLVADGRAWLPSLVLLELYAGTTSAREKRAVDALRRAARNLGRLYHPTEEDMCLAGEILASHGRRAGAVRPRDHSHDLLIAIAAARSGTLLLTENIGDMRRWAEALRRRARLRVIVRRPPS